MWVKNIFAALREILIINSWFLVNIEQTDQQKKRQNQDNEARNNSKVPKKATDDYHFDKFKKQFRRH